MGFFDDEKTALKYIRMAEGYDGRELVDILTRFLPAGARVLELGMGPGKDLALLSQHYEVTGSDRSAFYVELYLTDHPGADVEVLDAVSLDTIRPFDAIYSNKVLHHLTTQELEQSLAAQARCLGQGGLVCHSFWHGEGVLEMDDEAQGLLFQYYDRVALETMVDDSFSILHLEQYGEMDRDDSWLLIARRK